MNVGSPDPAWGSGSDVSVVGGMTNNTASLHSAFVGRDAPLREARALVSDALDGLPAVLVVEGPLGIGKTRFISEVARVARAAGMPIVATRCPERPGAPLRPFVDSLVPRLLTASETVPELKEFQPPLQSIRDGIDPPPSNTIPKLVEATLWFSQTAPLALIVDDVQWADSATLDVLDDLAYRLAIDDPQGRSLVLVVSMRTEQPDGGAHSPASTIWSMSKHPLSRTITLDGLSEAELVSMAQTRGLRSRQNRLGHRLARFSGGNPLIAEFVITQIIGRDPGMKFLARRLAETPLPGPLVADAHRLIERLSPACRELLDGLALVDMQPSVALLSQLFRQAERDVEKRLGEALERGLVRLDEGRVAFSDVRIRHAVRSLPRRPHRARLVSRWADLLVARALSGADTELSELASFMVEHPSALPTDATLRWLAAAAAKSSSRGEWAAASELYEVVLSLMADVDTASLPMDAAALFETAGLCAQHAGDDDDALALLERAAAGYGDTSDHVGRARVINQLMRVANRSPSTRHLLDRAVIAEAREKLGEGQPAIAAGLDVHLIDTCVLEADFESADRIAATLAELDDAVPDETVALAELAMAKLAMIHFDLGAMRRHHEAAYHRSLAANDAQLTLNAASFHAISLIFNGELARAHDVAENMLRVGDRSGLPLAKDLALALAAGTAVSLGDLATAREAIDRAVTIEQATERGNVANLLYPLGAAVAVAAGDRPNAIRLLDAGEDRMQSYDPDWLRAQMNAVQAWSYARLGDITVAEEHLLIALEANFDRMIFFGVPDVAAALIDAAHLCGMDGSKALPAIDRALEEGQLFSGTLCLFLPRVRALALADSGDEARALAAMEDARHQAESLGAVLEAARCCIDIIRLRLQDSLLSDDERSVELSHKVDAIVRRTGLLSLDSELRRIAAHRQLGARGAGQYRYIAFIDVVDSTRLTRELGNHAYLDRARRLRTVLDALVARWGGEVQSGVLLGDGLLALFAEAQPAVAMAVEASASARAAGLEVAIGIHAGEVLVDNLEAHGIAVNTASRFCDVAEANQVCLSTEVRDAMTSRGPMPWRLQANGAHAMKGLTEPQDVFVIDLTKPESSSAQTASSNEREGADHE